MKKITISLITLLCVLTISAQDITTMWPYKYPDFRDGTVYFKSRQTLSAPVNVHLLKSSLHYLDKEEIKEVTTSDIVLVQVDNDSYFMRNNQLIYVIAGDSLAFLGETLMADFAALQNSGGAYGSSSSVQATNKLSSIDIGGITLTNHMELKSQKEGGSLLPVTRKYYIVTAENIYPATRKGIESELSGSEKEAFKQFVKQHKINWKRQESLITLLEFFKN